MLRGRKYFLLEESNKRDHVLKSILDPQITASKKQQIRKEIATKIHPKSGEEVHPRGSNINNNNI